MNRETSDGERAPTGRLTLLQPVVWWTLALAYALWPLGDRHAARPPWGRPWHLGVGLPLLTTLATLLVLESLRDPAIRVAARWRRSAAALLFLATFVAAVSNFLTLTSDDNLPSRALPLAIVSGDGFDLSSVLPPDLHDNYSVMPRGGRLLSAFPLGTGLLAVPFYGTIRLTHSYTPRVLVRDVRLEKHAAALAVGGAVALLFLASVSIVGVDAALVFGFGLALGSPLLTSLAQGLWSQTGELLAFAAALAFAAIARERHGSGAPIASGLAMAMALLCRPTAILLAPLAVLWLPASKRRGFLVAFVAATALILFVQFTVYGSPLGGYGQINQGQFNFSSTGYWHRLVLVLASPSRGLFWYFPALLVAGFRIRSLPEDRLPRRLVMAAGFGIAALVVVVASYSKWWGGHSLGPRLLAEAALPALLVSATVARWDPRRAVRTLVILLIASQGVVELTLTESPEAIAWSRTVNVDHDPDVLCSLRNSLLAAAFVPAWRFRPSGPYLAAGAFPASGERDVPVDLAPLANARYDLPGVEMPLPRLADQAPAQLNTGRFVFMPPGVPNVVRVCAGAASPELPLAEVAADAIYVVAGWRGSANSTPSTGANAELPVGGTVVVTARNGARRPFPLRVGSEIFDTSPDRWIRFPPPDRFVAGRPSDPQALVLQILAIPGHRFRPASLRFVGRPDGGGGCLSILAVTLRESAGRKPGRSGR